MMNLFGDAFGFFSMAGNYEERKVAHYEEEKVMVDTCRVDDSDADYETAVEHPAYNNGSMVIVETYDTKEEAQGGHDKWVTIMTSRSLPDRLFDVSTAAIKKLGEVFGVDYSQGYERQTPDEKEPA